MSENAATPLGCNQRAVLSALNGYGVGSPRPYPGGGWRWTSDRATVRLLESLVRRGLVETRPWQYARDAVQYHITPAGIEALKGNQS